MQKRIRIAAALLIVVVLLILGGSLLPVYIRNVELQRFVAELAQRDDSRTRPDAMLRIQVVQEAQNLGLPVKANHVLIDRAGDQLRIEVRYTVPASVGPYRVDLHFYPGAGGR
ncbi:MAG: hypothetical protein ACKV22_12060 [Bryobacteraceae bacterium]